MNPPVFVPIRRIIFGWIIRHTMLLHHLSATVLNLRHHRSCCAGQKAHSSVSSKCSLSLCLSCFLTYIITPRSLLPPPVCCLHNTTNFSFLEQVLAPSKKRARRLPVQLTEPNKTGAQVTPAVSVLSSVYCCGCAWGVDGAFRITLVWRTCERSRHVSMPKMFRYNISPPFPFYHTYTY